ncbi:acyl-CoA dehydrogenase [Mesorhizobium sp. L-8-10]|uniref:acyl-CoA dehydrogenase family protein n=1 Tax=Mesorhizobium sp. L-8-10 TaxID=2744523 RepID=UPI00192979B3|nr:acyl-CoA dehydrogenase family protein [Mesorhizobium sp. L-8-10]BCH35169.1 acyl-CoA dehydrogenase [Mesorhizobium sp. L-8-10]
MTCDLNRSEDQRQILDTAAAMLEAQYPVSRLRRRDPDDLSGLAAFGALGLALPEAQGGAGFSLAEEALLHVLLGRHVVSTRVLAAAVGARLLTSTGDGLAFEVIAGGTAVCAAIPVGGDMLLVDRSSASLALVFDNRRLALVEIGDAAGRQETGLGRSIPVERLGAGSGRTVATSSDDGLLGVADLMISAQLLGIAEGARDLTVAYAQMRHQFGQPIGGFQAVKHHCANMAIAAETVSAQLDMAALAARDGRDDASFQIAALRRLATAAALGNVRTAIQVHGGIGFSAEADVHHYLKQAHLLSRLGQPADLLALPAPLAPHTSLSERD